MASKNIFILCLLLISVSFIHAQDNEITLVNPSFEAGPARNGAANMRSMTIGWRDCGEVYFTNRTPHDIHKGWPRDSKTTDIFFGVRQPASHGNNFLGLVVRDDDTYEGVSQRLSRNIEADKCYTFKVDLSKSNDYISPVPVSEATRFYTTPVVLRIFGGSSYCGKRELLAETERVRNTEWETYELEFKARADHQYITFVAFYKVPVLFPYNGNLLVDNAGSFEIIPCPEEEFAEAEVEDDPEPVIDEGVDEVVPEVEEQETVVIELQPSTVPAEAPIEKLVIKNEKPSITINEELNREKMVEGQTIKINRLYFAADASEIDPKSTPALKELAEFLKFNDDIVVEIGGHTNRTPAHRYCDSLSTERAKSVAQFLLDEGISKDQLEYKGYGKRNPIAKEKSRQARARNQRVEIKILKITK